MKRKFVTYLGTDRFLSGVIALNASLKEHNKNVGLLVLVGESVSSPIIEFLREEEFLFKRVKDIQNPFVSEDDSRGRRHMYTKIRVFELIEYDKVVFLDADMIVCDNIEILFEKEHMSAVVAGNLAPQNSSWVDFNSGLMVISPDIKVYREMMKAINVLESYDGTDQGFLNAFYSSWKGNSNLQLDHKYNVPTAYLDDYCKLYDFDFDYSNDRLFVKNVAILHYFGSVKPWDMDLSGDNRSVEQLATKSEQTVALWWNYFFKALKRYGRNAVVK